MIPERGRLYQFDFSSRRLVPANAGVELPVGTRISDNHRGEIFVVVSDTIGAAGQRAIELESARTERELSRASLSIESYKYRELEGRATLPDVCALIAKREEVMRAGKIALEESKRRADDARRRGAELLAAKRPAWAKAAIIAELEVDKSEIQTDYFATSTSRTVLLAWSRHKRDLFPELRKAAARFSETAHLATAPPTDGPRSHPSDEHREKWSMGGGYYLKAGQRYSSGWKVSKTAYWSGLEVDLGMDPAGNYLAD